MAGAGLFRCVAAAFLLIGVWIGLAAVPGEGHR